MLLYAAFINVKQEMRCMHNKPLLRFRVTVVMKFQQCDPFVLLSHMPLLVIQNCLRVVMERQQ